MIRKILKKVYFFINERTYQGRLKYVYKRNHSKTLIVSFSGFSPTPVYNYMRTLNGVASDQLFILDDFGFKGSYYWYENGEDIPRRLTFDLISKIINGGGYDRVITIGSSKGGTCAIYYGLLLGASDIYSGACQYYVGKYLNTEAHLPIMNAMMMGYSNQKAEYILDRMLPDVIKQSQGTSSKVHLLYSKQEHTYDEHIKFLIEDLKKYDIDYDEQIEEFDDHSVVGKFFSPWVLKNLNNINNEK